MQRRMLLKCGAGTATEGMFTGLSLAQAGWPERVVTSWGALATPAGTPRAITARLSQAVQEIAAQPEMKERFLTAGARITASTPQETAAFAAW